MLKKCRHAPLQICQKLHANAFTLCGNATKYPEIYDKFLSFLVRLIMMWLRSQRNTEDGIHLKKGNRITLGKDPNPNNLWPKDWDSHKKYSFNSESKPLIHYYRCKPASSTDLQWYIRHCISFELVHSFLFSPSSFAAWNIPFGFISTGHMKESKNWLRAGKSLFDVRLNQQSQHPHFIPRIVQTLWITHRFDRLMHCYLFFEDCYLFFEAFGVVLCNSYVNTRSLRQTGTLQSYVLLHLTVNSLCTLEQSLNNTRMTDIILITHPHRDQQISQKEQGQLLGRERKEQSMFSLVCQRWHEQKVCHTGTSHRKQTNNCGLSASSQQMGTVRNTQSSAVCKKYVA